MDRHEKNVGMDVKGDIFPMISAKNKRMLWLFIVVVAAIAVKYIYLCTSERWVDIEELPADALRIVTGSAVASEIGSSRLYNFNYITNTLFLAVFGYKISSLKLTSLAFFILSCVAVLRISYDWFEDRPAWIKWLPFSLIAFGPPIAQMWALKNRGGFIETWAILAWLIWYYGKWCKAPDNRGVLFSIGALCGVAIWVQPLALTFVLPIFFGVAWQSFQSGWRETVSRLTGLTLFTLLGMMPLIALNFLYRFNTFRVIEGGEYGLGAAAPWERLLRLFRQGLPRLAGLKQQWLEAWVFPRSVSIALFFFFCLISLIALLLIFKNFLRDRKFDSKMLALSTIFLVLTCNVASSWGSFQGEPRRLLLLYVPLSLIVVWAFSHSRRVLIGFSLVWFFVSGVSNYSYVRANPHGFNSPFYVPYNEVTDFLISKHVNTIYSGVWISAKIEFESHMNIAAYKNPYVGSGASVPGVGKFGYRSSAVFHVAEPGQDRAFRQMLSDLKEVGVSCLDKNIKSFRLIYGCSGYFDIYRLHAEAEQIREFSDLDKLFEFSHFHNGSLPGFYEREPALVWTEPGFSLTFFLKEDKDGNLCIQLGTQRLLDASSLKVNIDGTAMALGAFASGSGERVAVSTNRVRLMSGAHQLSMNVPPFVPGASGAGDLRALGLPLQSVSIVSDSAECVPAHSH